MALCSANPYNVTLTFAMNGIQQGSNLIRVDNGHLEGRKSKLIYLINTIFLFKLPKGPYGDYVLKVNFLDEPE